MIATPNDGEVVTALDEFPEELQPLRLIALADDGEVAGMYGEEWVDESRRLRDTAQFERDHPELFLP